MQSRQTLRRTFQDSDIWARLRVRTQSTFGVRRGLKCKDRNVTPVDLSRPLLEAIGLMWTLFASLGFTLLSLCRHSLGFFSFSLSNLGNPSIALLSNDFTLPNLSLLTRLNPLIFTLSFQRRFVFSK